MFDALPLSPKIALFDGAKVRLNIAGHAKPVFYADACHGAFCINGELYYRDGTPVDDGVPAIVEMVAN